MAIDLLLPEFDQEMASTRKVLDLVPTLQDFGWKPRRSRLPVGPLASHIAEHVVSWTTVHTMTRPEFDLGGVTPEEMNQAARNQGRLLLVRRQRAVGARRPREARRRLFRAVDAEKWRHRVLHDAALQLRAQLRA